MKEICPLGKCDYDEDRGEVHLRGGFIVRTDDKILYVDGEQTYSDCYTKGDYSIGTLEDSVIFNEMPRERRDIFKGYKFRGRRGYDSFFRKSEETAVCILALGGALTFLGGVGFGIYKAFQYAVGHMFGQ